MWPFDRHDFFISYRQNDARGYAAALTASLEGHGFDCFLDRKNIPQGADIRSILRRSLRNSATLIVVASDGAFKSDWVSWELDQFQSKKQKAIIGIDFDGSLSEAGTDGTPFETFKDKLYIRETGDSLRNSEPSQETIENITRSFFNVRANSRRLRALLLIAGVSATVGFILGISLGRLL